MLGQAMEAEIRQQPSILRENSSKYYAELKSALQGRSFDMVLLAARGSSDNAALYARYLFEIHLQIPVTLAAPSVLTRYGSKIKYKNCLAIGLSQSGAAPDVSEVLGSMRSDGHFTIGITNTEGSRLTQVSEFSLQLGCGLERSVAATKTYSASLLALFQTARALGADLPDPSADLPGEEWLFESELAATLGLGPILRCNTIFALARGYQFCSALETALKLMECALLPCKAYSTADFQHGPKALASHGSAAVVYGEPLPFLTTQGAASVAAPTIPSRIPEHLWPLWDIPFGQFLALGAARARGLNPDDPQHITKVTETL
jgi:glucosamine--fructose-6-phosphate aminotransferase (isomerizing)